MAKIPYFVPDISAKEIGAVNKVLCSRWISAGNILSECERKFEKKLNVNKGHCVGVSSGYSALYLSMFLAGIKKNDIVLMPNINFVASMNAAKQLNARIKLVDSESKFNPNISINDLKKKLSSKVKAIIVMHYGGYPCDMHELLKLKKKYNFILIEDSCHAIFSKYQGKTLGSFGDFSAFSFYANKNITSGEGGMLYCKKAKDVKRAKLLKNHGLNTNSFLHKNQSFHAKYDIKETGFNFRLDDLRASLLSTQLDNIEKKNKIRYKIFLEYKKNLKKNKKIKILFSEYSTNEYSRHLFVIKTNFKKLLEKKLKKNGISYSCHYKPISYLSAYKTKEKYPNSKNLFKTIISLPIYPKLTKNKISKICDIINSI